jgi:uncharacterized membrane protein
MKKLLLLLVLSTYTLHGLGQVIFKNSGTSKIFVAYCFGNVITGWTSKGWFPVEPGEEKPLYNITVLGSPKFYYCAKIAGCDQGYYGTVQLMADDRHAFSIQHADRAQAFANPDIKQIGFREINLAGRTTYLVELKPMNLTCNGQRQGKWRVPLDKEGDYAEKQEDAQYYREITFADGRPLGWSKDYYLDGALRGEFKLTQAKPAIYDGKCTWYKKDGSIDKELTYQNGAVINSVNYDSNGVPISQNTRYEAIALPVQNFFVNSTSNESFKGGHSKITYPVNLPPNTVKWYYEFSASRSEEEVKSISANFSAASKLASMVDKSGLLSLSIDIFTAPPGANYCNVYIMDQQNQLFFLNKQGSHYLPNSSRLNFKSGIVEVNEPNLKNPVIGIANPDLSIGVNVSVQVVAIVAKSY